MRPWRHNFFAEGKFNVNKFPLAETARTHRAPMRRVSQKENRLDENLTALCLGTGTRTVPSACIDMSSTTGLKHETESGNALGQDIGLMFYRRYERKLTTPEPRGCESLI
jgi:hypothetical protein